VGLREFTRELEQIKALGLSLGILNKHRVKSILTSSTSGLRNVGTFCAKKRTKVANITTPLCKALVVLINLFAVLFCAGKKFGVLGGSVKQVPGFGFCGAACFV
tara:strand:+ start:861 stop:1172 length:312 start_codon:yes stop_codon:yes gene_type:complete